MPKTRRSRIFVDAEVQGAILRRIGSYWLFCLVSVSLLLLCWEVMTGPPKAFTVLFLEMFQRHAPALAAALILLPIALLDAVRLSHRFVGPIVRLRRGLTELAHTGTSSHMAFRAGDYWHDLASEFNRVAARLERVEGLVEPQVIDDVLLKQAHPHADDSLADRASADSPTIKIRRA